MRARYDGFLTTTGRCDLCGLWRRLQRCEFHKGQECRRCRFSPHHKKKYPKLSANVAREVRANVKASVESNIESLAADAVAAGDPGSKWLQHGSHADLPDYKLLMTRAAITDLERLPEKTREATEYEVVSSGWRFSMGLAQEVDSVPGVHAFFDGNCHILLRGDRGNQTVLILRILKSDDLIFEEVSSDDLEFDKVDLDDLNIEDI